jgi:predicted ATPase
MLAHLRLAGLSIGDLRRLVSDRLGGIIIPEPLVELLWQKTAGQPLFSQQLLDSLLDQGLLTVKGADCLLAPETDLEILFSSESIQDLIKNRIDSLPPGAQMTLKVASVIGREFDRQVLEAIYPAEGQKQELVEDLRLLQKFGLITRQSEGPEARFSFTEILTQENVYGLMLFAQRRALHRAAAEWYDDTIKGQEAQSYALLAYHWEQADDPAKAIHYLEKAGDEANRQGDAPGAVRFFDRALALDANAAVLSDAYPNNEE